MNSSRNNLRPTDSGLASEHIRRFMKSRIGVFLSTFLSMVVINTSLAFAQHDHNRPQGNSSDMMQQCQKHHSEIASLVNQAAQTLADARQLGSLEEMRSAIDKAQSQLNEMKHHISMCPMSMAETPDKTNEHMKCMSSWQDSEQEEHSFK
jgi:hypothetical protein